MANKPRWEEIQKWIHEEALKQAGQMDRGQGFSKKHYAPPFGQGIPYTSPSREMSPTAPPQSKKQLFMDMEQYGAPPRGNLRQLTPEGIQQLQKQQQLQELGKILQQQQQSQPRNYTRPFEEPTQNQLNDYKQNHPINRMFEEPTQNQLNDYKQNHPMNRMWDALKNYR